MPRDEPDYSHLPIPTYEEAISSRPTSSSHQGESSSNAERQGLIGSRPRGAPQGSSSRANDGYQPPTVESARSSFESGVTSLASDDTDRGAQEIRRDMEEMEIDEGENHRRRRGDALRRARQIKDRILDRIAVFIASTVPRVSSISPRLGGLSSIREHLPAWPSWLTPNYALVARLVALSILITAVYILVVFQVLTPSRMGMGTQFIPESIRNFAQENINRGNIEQNLRQITQDNHIAGTRGDFFLAEWIKSKFQEAKLDSVYTEDFYAYLNYPKEGGRRVAIVEPEFQRWEAVLEEDRVNPELNQHQALAFHGLSKSGDVTGHLVYANYGARADFDWLASQGVNVTGAIILVRYYGYEQDRALKVKAAELAGAAGVLIYSDPADDGFLRGPTWPDGPWRTADSLQRGTVALTSWIMGDVLTPGWASNKKEKRIDTKDNPGLVNIPSLPLSWRDARVLLASIQHHGIPVPGNWKGGVPDIGSDTWWTGNETSIKVNLKNEQDEPQQQPIRNVFGVIQGAETPDAKIYLGNHRDAWCFGSVDPGTGTAILLEIVRVFGELLDLGWRPRRTLVFASWDAEEYNLIGSTEHVEAHVAELRSNAVAYLNVDVGVLGRKFRAAGSPLLTLPLMRALDHVSDPQTNASLQQLWTDAESHLAGLGASSDYAPFQFIAGCSALDLGFTAASPDDSRSEAYPPPFPYHSCYETFRWVREIGDPGFAYSSALAQVWMLLALELADEPLLSLDAIAYADAIVAHVEDLEAELARIREVHEKDAARGSSERRDDPDLDVDVAPLRAAAQDLRNAALSTAAQANAWHEAVVRQGNAESRDQGQARLALNAALAGLEAHLLDLPAEPGRVVQDPSKRKRGEGGVPGRTQYKHVVFAPARWDSYVESYVFPLVRDAVEDGDYEAARRGVEVIAAVLRDAAARLA